MAAPRLDRLALEQKEAYLIVAEVTKSLLRAESQNRLLRVENELLRSQLLDSSQASKQEKNSPAEARNDQHVGRGSGSESIAAFRAGQECERNLEALYRAIVAQLRLHASVESELLSLAQCNVSQQRRVLELSEVCEEHTNIIADALRRELADAHRIRASPGGLYVEPLGSLTPDDR
jgi:hypothetical protein